MVVIHAIALNVMFVLTISKCFYHYDLIVNFYFMLLILTTSQLIFVLMFFNDFFFLQVLIAGVTILIRQTLRPIALSPGQTTLTLRLALSDVEKSLQQVYTSPNQSQYQSIGGVGGYNDRNRSNSVSPFPRSPSFHFPPTTLTKKNKEKDVDLNLSLTLPDNNEKGGLEKDDFNNDEGNRTGNIYFCFYLFFYFHEFQITYIFVC